MTTKCQNAEYVQIFRNTSKPTVFPINQHTKIVVLGTIAKAKKMQSATPNRTNADNYLYFCELETFLCGNDRSLHAK